MAPNRAIIKLHNSCNNRCVFCHCRDNRNDHRTLENVEALLDHLPKGVNQILLSGGEPTTFPQLKMVLNSIRKRGLKSGFISNGRMFSYSALSKDAINMGADYFYISLHSHDPSTHDSITRVENSHNEVLLGIENLVKYSKNPEVILNCVVVKSNANHLPKIVSLAHNLGITRLKFSIPEIKGCATRDTDQKLESLGDASSCIVEAIAEADRIGLPCSLDGTPYCFVESRLHTRFENLETNRIFYMAEVSENQFHPTDESERIKHDDCIFCSYSDICNGWYPGYENFDGFAIAPISKRIPNYFDLYKTSVVEGQSDLCKQNCVEHHEGLSPKTMFVSSQSVTETYEAYSDFFKLSDFAAAAKKGQVFTNLTADSDSHDIGNLSKLLPSSDCPDCNNSCLGNFSINNAKPFFSLSKKMSSTLESLEGEVLDVGSGELYLKDLFFNKLKDRIRYTGLEPDYEKFKTAQTLYPEVKFVNGTLENELFEPSSFDHILMLGSYQHLENLKNSLANVTRILKQSGRLLIMENSVFGVLSVIEGGIGSEAIFSQTETNSFEHFRNHCPKDAVKLLELCGFAIVTVEHVSRNSNFWMIEASVRSEK